jgi:anti-sigma B factor antagonist
MEMQFSEAGGVTKAVLGGRVAFSEVGTEAETDFMAHIVPKEQPAVVDMSEVSFVNTLGIRMLIRTAQALGSIRLALYGANDNVMDILEHTDLREIIRVVDTEAEAVAAVMT